MNPTQSGEPTRQYAPGQAVHATPETFGVPTPAEEPDSMVPAGGQHPARKSRRTIALGAFVALLLAIACGAIGFALGSPSSDAPTAAKPADDSATTETTETTPEAIPLTPADFSLSVLTEEQKCFGSAGCLVTISLTPTFNGFTSTLEGRSFKVLYEIQGGEEPILDRFTMTGTRVSIDETLSVETASSDAVITADVTQVIETTYDG